MKTIRVAIAEDHDLFRQGLAALLSKFSQIKIVFEAKDGKDLLNSLESNIPDILLLDIDMPVMDGRKALEKIKLKYPRLKVIVLTAFGNDGQIVDFYKFGINAFLPKDTKIDKLVDAINSVYENGAYTDLKTHKALTNEIKSYHGGMLSEKEKEVLKLVCDGNSHPEIATKIGIAVVTVRFHIKNINHKTECKTVADLVKYAIRNKIIFI